MLVAMLLQCYSQSPTAARRHVIQTPTVLDYIISKTLLRIRRHVIKLAPVF